MRPSFLVVTLLIGCTREASQFQIGTDDGGGGGDGSSNASDGSGGATDLSSLPDLAGTMCPDLFGKYINIKTSGPGCGNLSTTAPQCVGGTAVLCFAHFSSVPANQAPGAVNGGVTVGADGSFSGASLILGTNKRTNCSGSWDAASATMTVMCGMGTEECTITMTRSGACG